MRTWFTALLPIVFCLSALAQPSEALVDPVSWTVSVKRVQGDQWDLVFRADVQKGWYIYSQRIAGDLGPMPTAIVLDTLAHVHAIGESVESGEQVVEGHDAMFDMVLMRDTNEAWRSMESRFTSRSTPSTR